MPRKPRTAILIDAENSGDRAGRLAALDEIIGKSNVAVRLAVGSYHTGKAMRRELADRGFAVVLPASGGKNAADLTLTARGAALLAVRPRIARFVIVSGDRDFDALHQVLVAGGREVVRIGRREEVSAANDTPGTTNNYPGPCP